MKKIIKLILLAAIVVGVVVALIQVIMPTSTVDPQPAFESEQAKDWKKQIDALCQDGKWNEAGYNKIETGIHSDRVTSKGELLSLDEENALQKYLFTASCEYIGKQVDNMFKQTRYDGAKINNAKKTVDFLAKKLDRFGANSNLSLASGILSEYSRLAGSFSFSSAASYSRPLRRYSGGSVEAAKARIQGMKYYKSHFSKNPSIRSKVDNLASDRARAEQEYYMNLERAIEAHYRNYSRTERLEDLLKDQDQFIDISTNSAATNKLKSFVNS